MATSLAEALPRAERANQPPLVILFGKFEISWLWLRHTQELVVGNMIDTSGFEYDYCARTCLGLFQMGLKNTRQIHT